MNKEFTVRLYERFPALYRQHSLPMQETAMCWGFDHDDGWFNIVWMLSLALEDEARATGGAIEAVQVKEKFGGLRFYLNGTTDRAHDFVTLAERLSEITCEVCGKSGQITGGGWLKCVCKEHQE